MYAEKLSIKIVVIVLSVFWLGACSGSNPGEWSGKISGDVRVGDKNDPAYSIGTVFMYEGNDTLTLQPAGADYHLYFGNKSVIQDCDITFFYDTVEKSDMEVKKYRLKRAEKLHDYGKKDAGLPCRGIVDKAGTVEEVEIHNSSVVSAKVFSDNTETYEVTIYYQPVGSTALYPPLVYQMLSGKKGWF